MTCHLVLFYISTKYHKNIPKGLWLWHEINGLSLSNITREENANSKKGRVVIFVCNTSSGSVLHFCQVPSKYSKGYSSSYRADTKSFSNKTKDDNSKSKNWLCWGLTTRQPLRVILCRLPEKGRKEIEERVEEMKERDREERGTGMKVKKQKK